MAPAQPSPRQHLAPGGAPAAEPARPPARRFDLALRAGLALAVLARMPMLLGPRLVVDVDEAILGLMAHDVLAGGPLPVFFWGQNYGLSTLEAGVGALAFAVFGPTAAALKGAMLGLWAAGWAAFVLAARRLGGGRAALLTGVLLLACPAWTGWSMKARGGYLTAFLLTGLALWLVGVLRAPGQRTRTQCAGLALALGVALGFDAFAQPFWLLAFAPFLTLLPWRRLGWRGAAALTGGGALAAGTVLLAATHVAAGAWAPSLLGDGGATATLADLPARLGAGIGRLPLSTLVFMSGAYWHNTVLPMGDWTSMAAHLWRAALVAAVALPLAALARRRRLEPVHAAALATAVALGLTVPIAPEMFAFRYLQPVAGFAPLALGLGAARAGTWPAGVRRTVWAVLALLALTGGSALWEARNIAFYQTMTGDNIARRDGLRPLTRALEARAIRHVYTMDPFLQWELAFASGGRLKARWTPRADRRPDWARAVDRARAAGEPVALVARGQWADRVARALKGQPGEKAAFWQEQHYLIVPSPEPALLDRLGFEPAS